MSEQEAGHPVQPGEEGDATSPTQDSQEMTQKGLGSGQAATEEGRNPEMETEKAEQKEPSGPSRDPEPAEGSPGAGSEDGTATGDERSGSAPDEEEREASLEPREDPSGPDQAGTGTGGSLENPNAAKDGEEVAASAAAVEPLSPHVNSNAAEASKGTGQADETPATPEKEKGAPEEDETAKKTTPPASSHAAVEEAGSSDEQRVAIVTGANNGIGLVAAERLARDGYEVIMACRSEEKATKAVREVEKRVPGARLSFMKLDLSSLRSVREFADAFCSRGGPLHILCNNAGLTTGFSLKERQETEDGFEMTMGVNHLGHFLLTHLLLEDLRRTASRCGEARIVHTASMVHDPDNRSGKRGAPAHLDFENLMMDKPGTFSGELAYKNSKLANCAFSVELAKRLEGTNITSNTLCPGFIPSTGLIQNETLGLRIRLTLVTPILKLLGVIRTVEHGGGLIHDVATNPQWKGVTGKHFQDFKEMLSSKESRDPDVGKRLWDLSADLVQHEQAKAL